MTLYVIDAASFVFSELKTGSLSEPVAGYLIGGTDSVLESGDLSARGLAAYETVRRSEEEGAKALALSVQDDGEESLKNLHGRGLRGLSQQRIILRIYDRQRGIRNIRLLRDFLVTSIPALSGMLTAQGGVRRGIGSISYMGRSGLRFDQDFSVDYEALTFLAVVERSS